MSGWSYASRRVRDEVEVMATASPSGARFLLVYAAGGRVRAAHFLPPGKGVEAAREVRPATLPPSVLAGSSGERSGLLAGF